MNPSIFVWLDYVLWGILVVYLIVAAVGAKQDTERHLGRSFGLMLALIAPRETMSS